MILIFVDDTLLFSLSKERILEAKQWLLNEYKMTDLANLKQFLGMQIFRDRKRKTTFVGHERYFQKVLERCRMQECKGTSTPMETKLSLVKLDDKDIIGELEYQSLVGSIMYRDARDMPRPCILGLDTQ